MSTLATILVFAQEAAHGAEHEETSKALFYVVGGITAAVAVLVAALGIKKHDFPGTDGAARGVMALFTVLVLATMASSIITS